MSLISIWDAFLFSRTLAHLFLITLFRSWNLAGICPVFNRWHWSGRGNWESSLNIWESIDSSGAARDKRNSSVGSLPWVWECHPGDSTGKAGLVGCCQWEVVVELLKSYVAPSSASLEKRGCGVTHLFPFSCIFIIKHYYSFQWMLLPIINHVCVSRLPCTSVLNLFTVSLFLKHQTLVDDQNVNISISL